MQTMNAGGSGVGLSTTTTLNDGPMDSTSKVPTQSVRISVGGAKPSDGPQ